MTAATSVEQEKVTKVEFFQRVMNQGAGDNVACFKLIVILILILAALVIGNAAFVFTSSEIYDDFTNEVRLAAIIIHFHFVMHCFVL